MSSVNVSTTNFSSINISTTNFSSINISTTNLSSINVSTTNLSSVNFSTTNILSVNLSTTNFSTVFLYGPSCIIPIGGIIMYSGYWPPKDTNSTPSLINNNVYITNFINNNNWILCDGGDSITISSLPTNTNISYQLIGTTPKSINMFPKPTTSNLSSFNFSIPDLRGRFVLGCCKNDPTNSDVTFNYTSTIQGTVHNSQKLDVFQSLNQTSLQISDYNTYPGELNKYGGVMSQTIIENEMPSHTHGLLIGGAVNIGVNIEHDIDSNLNGGGARTMTRVWNGGGSNYTAQSSANFQYSGSSQQTGGNQYRSKLPPYWVLSYIMRIG